MNDPRYTDDLDVSIQGDLAIYLASLSQTDWDAFSMTAPGSWAKPFHLRTAGFTGTMNYLRQKIMGKGWPVNRNLQIMPLGDSITWGYLNSTGDGINNISLIF